MEQLQQQEPAGEHQHLADLDQGAEDIGEGQAEAGAQVAEAAGRQAELPSGRPYQVQGGVCDRQI